MQTINKVVSTDANSPIIAEVADDTLWQNSVVIPAGTRAFGHALLEEATRRVQARFETLVFPDGEQHGLSAIALAEDGASGIGGSYYSQTIAKQGGRFLGNFVAGLAEGTKDRRATGQQGGIILETGSIKNGLLNGLSASALDHAKRLSEETKVLAPTLKYRQALRFFCTSKRSLRHDWEGKNK